MKPSHSLNPCFGCTGRILCRCLRVREATVVEAIVTLGLRTVKEIRQHTGAGDGCTCCHGELGRCLDDYAPVLTGEAIWPAQFNDCKAAIRWILTPFLPSSG